MSIAPTSAGHPDVPGKKISLSSALSSPKGAPQVARSMQHPHNFGPVVQGAVENHVTTVGEAAQTQGKLVAGAAGERV